jgi:hypothetical protein
LGGVKGGSHEYILQGLRIHTWLVSSLLPGPRIWSRRLTTTLSNCLLERKVCEVKQENIKAAALMPTVVPRSVLGTIAVNLETNMPGTVSFMSRRQTINRRIHRLRNFLKRYPSRPFDDLEDLLDQFTMTIDLKSFLFLNYTVKQDNKMDATRIIVFMSDAGAEVLAACKS